MKKKTGSTLRELHEAEMAKQPRKISTSKLIALAIPAIIGQTNARFVMSNPFSPHVLCIHGPSLRKHLSPKMTKRDLEIAMKRAFSWGLFMSYSYSNDVYVVSLTPPIGMKLNTQDEVKRPSVTLENIAAIIGDSTRKRRKAQIIEMDITRRLNKL